LISKAVPPGTDWLLPTIGKDGVELSGAPDAYRGPTAEASRDAPAGQDFDEALEQIVSNECRICPLCGAIRMLARIIADLDELAGYLPMVEERAARGEDAETRCARHRQRLAEPEPPARRLPLREERAALRALLDLPPSGKG
jgi:hypothetical protein